MSNLRFSVDPWDPTYGASVERDLEPSSADVTLDVEVAAGDWSPRTPPVGYEPSSVLFVDGVRRVEARLWIDAGDDAHPGICASYAAGAVLCDGTARFVTADVGRGLFTASPLATDVTTHIGPFPARMAASSTPEALSLALQERMGTTEVEVAKKACDESAAELVVVDGPLRGRAHLTCAVGMIKTHQVAYLPSEQHRVVAALAPGQRTPVFTLGTSWSRHSWYLRLPGAEGGPWAGVVRCEASPDLSPLAVSALADSVTALLPRFASESHKDSRAPQNLYPIAALERELRRRLGDAQLVYRALRQAARSTRAA